MTFLPPKIGTNRRRGHYLCLNEEVPVDKKIPHRLNPSCRHCCNLLEPCNRKSRRVCRPEAWTSILHEDFIKRCTYTFSERATAYLAFWSSICCPEYIFLLGSWSTLPERVPSSLFAFRTWSMKEWLFIWLEKKKGFDKELWKFTSFAKRTASFSISWAWAKLCGLSSVLNDSFSSLGIEKIHLFFQTKRIFRE